MDIGFSFSQQAVTSPRRRNSVLAYCAAWEVWESISFASLNIEVWSASPIQWINTLFNVTVKGGIRSLHRPLDKPLVHRIEVTIIHMPCIIRLVTKACSQNRRCQMPRSPRAIPTDERRSPLDRPLENRCLINRQRFVKSPSSSGRVHPQCR